MQAFAARRISNSSLFRDHKDIAHNMTLDMMELQVDIGRGMWNQSVAYFERLTELSSVSIDSTF
jgi:hypothetical protein